MEQGDPGTLEDLEKTRQYPVVGECSREGLRPGEEDGKAEAGR